MLGEVGGFWLNIRGVTYVPIMVAEKGRVHMRLKTKGEPGHGSIPHEGSSLVRLARAIDRLESRRLPYHLTPVVDGFIRALIATQPLPDSVGLRGLLHARTAALVLDKVMPEKSKARTFHAMLHNTATPTIMRSGDKLNVIPPHSECDLDGRTLPGQTTQDIVREVRASIDDPEIEIEVVSEAPAVVAPSIETTLYETIVSAVSRHEPHAICVPYMITGFTDARAFHKLGTTCYGFSPLKLEPRHDLSFSELFHGVDERIPVEGYRWGQKLLLEVVTEFLSRPTS